MAFCLGFLCGILFCGIVAGLFYLKVVIEILIGGI